MDGNIKRLGIFALANDVSYTAMQSGSISQETQFDYEIKDPDLKWIEAFWNDELER